ncbi:MAG: hypothetical protein EXR51_09875 [Dehalococcoidia bacterium]|nr:hypothetical protein [Dehalococcoidia bacterium]
MEPAPATCGWGGAWDTWSGQEYFRMVLVQSGAIITGVYGTDRRIEGSVAADQFGGRWAGPPGYLEPNNAGQFIFMMAADCGSFAGSWGLDRSASGGGPWRGVRAAASANPPSASVDRSQVVTDLYRSTLCREPDPGGMAAWVNSGQPGEQIEAALAGSPEGIVVAAVRLLYLIILARDPIPSDCAGLRTWLTSAIAGSNVQEAFESSIEGQRVAAVRAIYLELLGRDPLWTDNRGLRAWVDSGVSAERIRSAIMASEEYRARGRR